MTRTERRIAERFGLKIPLRVRIAKPAALEHTVESLNVSTRGISFATDLPLCKGTPVHLTFVIDHLNPRFFELRTKNR